MSNTKVKVLYIAGSWRSGSTLIGRVLGQAQGMVSVCELSSIWKLGVQRNEPCSCGAGVRDCAFWQAVFQAAYGGLETAPVEEALRHGLPMFPTGDMLRMLAGSREAGLRLRLAAQRQVLDALYLAVAEVSGSRCIVDGSKIPSYAIGLSTLPSVDLYVLHLVRDSRAVTNSWLRRRQREWGADPLRVGARDAARQGLAWSRWHVMAETLLRPRAKYLRLRYEDFATAPRRAVQTVAGFLGEDLSSTPFVGEDVIHLADEHAADGNRMRFVKGDVAIRLDEQWQQELPAGLRRAVTATSWPLLLRYGYLGSPPAARSAPTLSVAR